MRAKPYPGNCDQLSPTRPVIQQGFISYQVNTSIHLAAISESRYSETPELFSSENKDSLVFRFYKGSSVQLSQLPRQQSP